MVATVRSAAPSFSPFQHRLGHFLHEKRDSIGALDDVQPNVLRQRLVARDAVDHGSDFALAQAG